MDLSSLVLQIAFIIIFGKMLAFGFEKPVKRGCEEHIKVKRLSKVRCHDLNLKTVPQNLVANVEILDLSFNRIKKLMRSSFRRYTSVRYLHLYENMILSVEPGTFEHMTGLEEIDLSNNALSTIPLEIFQLPSLRNLYMDSNELSKLHEDLQNLEKPIKAPLEYMNIAECTLENLPDLGPLPSLWHINASMNPLKELSIDRFAYMCHLSAVDFSKTLMKPCTCQQVNDHLNYLKIRSDRAPICLKNISYDICPLPYNYTVDSPTFQGCKSLIVQAETRRAWLFAAGCFGGVVLVLIIVWYCFNRKKKRQERRKKALQKRKKPVVSPGNAIHKPKDFEECLRSDIP